MKVGDRVRLTNQAGAFLAGDTGTIVEEAVAYDWRLEMDGDVLSKRTQGVYRGYETDFHLAVNEAEVELVNEEDFQFELGDRVRSSVPAYKGVGTVKRRRQRRDGVNIYAVDYDGSSLDFGLWTEEETMTLVPFEEGDRVRILCKCGSCIVGETGTVRESKPSDLVRVSLDREDVAFRDYNLSSLEPVEDEEPEARFEEGDRVRAKCGCPECGGSVVGIVLDVDEPYVSVEREDGVGTPFDRYRIENVERVEEDEEPEVRAVTVNVDPDRAEELASELRTLASELEEAAA